MTRRDFELIAEVIREETQDVGDNAHAFSALLAIAGNFARRLRATNPRFDRARFMAACGFKGE